jgi:hypothetical protein
MTQALRPFRFQIALSFPSEQRSRVKRIAEILATRLGKENILYDEWHRAEFARPNLDVYLPELYHKQSLLIVFFLCFDYERKEWCGLEWRAGRDLLKHKEDHRLMLLRLDSAEIQGLYSIDGHLDISSMDDNEVALDILKRLSSIPTAGCGGALALRASSLLSAPSDVPLSGRPALPEFSKYVEQLKKLPDTEILKKIWSQPYWRIWIRPWEFKNARFQNVEQCRMFMLTSSVPVQGWLPYPCFSAASLEAGPEWVAGEIDERGRTERWALFQSGQFVHNRAFDQVPRVTDGVHVTEILDTVTGAFEFASRMAKAKALAPRAMIQFRLHEVAGQGVTWPEDMFGSKDIVESGTWCQEKEITAERAVRPTELQMDTRELALDVALEIFSEFGWTNPPRDRLTEEQNNRFGH